MLNGDAVDDALADTGFEARTDRSIPQRRRMGVGRHVAALREAGGRIITNAEDGPIDAWERARVEKGRPERLRVQDIVRQQTARELWAPRERPGLRVRGRQMLFRRGACR